MKIPAALTVATIVTLAVALSAAIAATVPTAENPGKVQVASAPATPTPDKLVEPPYVLTWQKDPRYRGRDPFETVLHAVDAGNVRAVSRIAAPRTPGEEIAFVEKAAELVATGEAALEQGDYDAVKDALHPAGQMVAMKLVTQTAKDKMAVVSERYKTALAKYLSIRARLYLTEALQLATLMTAYFDSARYGDVIAAYEKMKLFDTEEGLRNPEVAATGSEILKKGAELATRAKIRIEFDKKELKVDAVSHFPEGRSYAIVNGEVYGEGVAMAPELAVSMVETNRVTFNYKGEQISLGLAQ